MKASERPREAPGEIHGIPEEHYRLLHSTAHVMAHAVTHLFPGVKLTVGPPVSKPYLGFYYDMDLDRRLGPEDLPAIEDEMRRIVEADHPFEPSTLAKDAARALFAEKGQDYKLDLIDAKARAAAGEGVGREEVTIYTSGDFVDLCRGPHVASTGACAHFKLLAVSGAYLWGDARRKQIQRIYGTAWPTAGELDRFVELHDGAAQRDHRKIGRELKLFQHHPEAPGSYFWLPRGAILYNTLAQKMHRLLMRNGYVEVKTPLLYQKVLWETSGHWDKFQDKLFTFEEGGQVLSLKPMNCPAHMLIYRSEKHSYRELPIRMHDQGVLHRREDTGAVEGVRRTFQFQQDDAHIFLRPDQVEEEIATLIGLVRRVYSALGLEFRCYLSISDWDENPDAWLGDRATWERAEADLRKALDANHLDYRIDPGEAAFYGPKVDFILPNVYGVFEHQCATIQLDFNLPERFGLLYTDRDNQEKQPIVVHRAIYGSFERYLATVIEHYAGRFPVWLAPVQCRILTISEASVGFGRSVLGALLEREIRAELDDRSEKIGYKIREFHGERIPYALVIGEKEAGKGTVNVRKREGGEEEMALEAFCEKIAGESKMEF